MVIGLSSPVTEALRVGAITTLPRPILRMLPGHGQAGRMAVHILSHDPLPGKGYREIGTEALVPIVAPGAKRHPDHHPDEWRRLVERLCGVLDALDSDHHWEYVRDQPHDRYGKVRCTDKPTVRV